MSDNQQPNVGGYEKCDNLLVCPWCDYAGDTLAEMEQHACPGPKVERRDSDWGSGDVYFPGCEGER